MSDDELRAHDLACAMIANPLFIEGVAQVRKKPNDVGVDIHIEDLYEELYAKYLKYFMGSK